MSKGHRTHKVSKGERRCSHPTEKVPDLLLIALGKGMYMKIKPPAPQPRERERVNRS